MNRLRSSTGGRWPAQAPKTQPLTKRQPNQRYVCSFCGKSCDRKASSFNVLSVKKDINGNPVPPAALCANCLDDAYALKNMGELYGEGNWPSLVIELHREVSGLPGSQKMKRIAVEMALRIAQRTHTMLNSGEVPPPLRLRVRGSDTEAFFELFRRALFRTGNACAKASIQAYRNGEAEKVLKSKCFGMDALVPHGVMMVDSPLDADPRYNTMCVAPDGLDLDGLDPAEIQ